MNAYYQTISIHDQKLFKTTHGIQCQTPDRVEPYTVADLEIILAFLFWYPEIWVNNFLWKGGCRNHRKGIKYTWKCKTLFGTIFGSNIWLFSFCSWMFLDVWVGSVMVIENSVTNIITQLFTNTKSIKCINPACKQVGWQKIWNVELIGSINFPFSGRGRKFSVIS